MAGGRGPIEKVKSDMPTFTLTDVSHEVWVEDMTVDAAQLGLDVAVPWSVSKRRLRGGRRDGVDLIVVDNGALRFAVVPTRGMGLWKGFYQGNFLGWESPITDGPVNPSYVNLMANGGLGWLDGYDEWMSRCGLENNGAPFEVKTVNPDGSERNVTFGLHGRIANIPASYVAVHIGAEAPHEIVIEGHVEESRLFGPQIRLEARYSTVPGSNVLSIHDEFVNLKDQPVEMQILYHCNFGPPFLGEGSRFIAPIRTVTPRDARAQEGIDQHSVYGRPEPGFAEQAYYYDLHSASADGSSMAMLRERTGEKAVVLRFQKDQLPAFTLWKNTAGLRDGYVTGLEPATNYPNKLPFEKARGRVVTLPPGGRYVVDLSMEVLATPDQVDAIESEIERRQAQGGPTLVNAMPVEPFAPVS